MHLAGITRLDDQTDLRPGAFAYQVVVDGSDDGSEAAVLALAFTPALSGHAVATSALAVVSDGLHVLSAGGWLGTLLLMVVAGLPLLAGTAERRTEEVAALLGALRPALALEGEELAALILPLLRPPAAPAGAGQRNRFFFVQVADRPLEHRQILFVEDVGEPPYRIDGLLARLRLAGILERLGGLVFGAFTAADTPAGRPTLSVDDVLAHYAGMVNGPVANGLVYGHFPMKSTLPVGVNARLDVSGGWAALTVLEAVVQ